MSKYVDVAMGKIPCNHEKIIVIDDTCFCCKKNMKVRVCQGCGMELGRRHG